MLEQTRVYSQKLNDKIETFHTQDFIERLATLTEKGNIFKSQEAQEFIKVVNAWHRINQNHARILAQLRPANVKAVRPSISTQVSGRLAHARTTILMENLVRLVKLPFGFLYDKTQAAALRYHLQKALENSVNITDFKDNLAQTLKSSKFDNDTSKIIREIIGEAENAETTLNKIDDLESEILSKNESDFKANQKSEILENLEKSQQFGRDMFILGEENLNSDVVKWTLENNKRVAINKLNPQKAQELGFKYPNDVRRTISADEIRHTLNNHGANSNNVKKSGQIPIDETDIANYQKISDNADETLKGLDNDGHLVEISFKQVNGHYVVVEQVRNKNNEFSFKTMYKGVGNYKDSKAYTTTAEKAQTLSQGYEPSANSFAQSAEKSIIPNPQAQSQAKSPLELAKAESERIRAKKQAEEIERKEAELKALKERQARQEQAWAEKDAKAGKSALNNELDTIKRFSNKYPRARVIFNNLGSKTNKENSVKLDIISHKKSKKARKMGNFNLQVTTPRENKNIYDLRVELMTDLKSVFNKPLTNKNDGRVAYISSKKVGKISSKDALAASQKNGFTQEQHFETAKHLKELYENSTLREIQPDRKGEINVQIPRYEAKFMLDGQPAIAKITLKETLTGLYKGNKIYTIELESVARLPTEP